MIVARAVEHGLITTLLGDGRSVMLSGPAGVGKTSLVVALAVQFSGRGEPVLSIRGSESQSKVMFGAFLPLLDEVHGLAPALIAARLRERASTAALVVVDDVHLLDTASAGMVNQLAADGVTVLLAARAGEPLPPAVTALAGDRILEVVELAPFDEQATGVVLAALLAGRVDRGTTQALYIASGGVALALRELLRSARERGSLYLRRGVWVIEGQLPAAGTLAELLRQQVLSADPDVRRAVELVVLADGLPLQLALRLVDRPVLERAEELGFLRTEGRVRPVILARHPLYDSAVVETMSSERQMDLYAELVGALDGSETGDSDRVSLGRWKLELGLEQAAGQWMELARLVHGADLPLAERFLRAAVDAGGGVEARLELANLLTHWHRVAEAEIIFADLERDALDPPSRAALLGTRAFLLAMPANRPREALGILEPLLNELGQVPELLACYSTALWRDGRVDEAIGVAQGVLARPGSAMAHAHAALTAGSAAIYGLRWDGFDSLVERMAGLADEASAQMPEAPEAVNLVRASRHALTNDRVLESGAAAALGYRAMLRTGNDGERSQYAFLYGWNRVLVGQVTVGLDYLREAHAGHGVWTPTTLPWLRSMLVRALVHAGLPDEAAQVLTSIEGEAIAGLYEADVALARAAAGAGPDRIRGLRAALSACLATGQRLRAGELAYAAMQLGDTAMAATVITLYERDPAPEARAIVAHARAVQSGKVELIVGAARQLERSGLVLASAEAMAGAVLSYREAGLHREAGLALDGLARIVAIGEGIAGPTVSAAFTSPLTDRELQLARLAATDAKDSDIALQLGISVRTVQTHLGRVYVALGIAGRGELAARLAAFQHPDPHPDSRQAAAGAALTP